MMIIAVIPVLIVMLAALCFWVAGYNDTAKSVSQFGTYAVIVFALGYVILVDSKKRWPGVAWPERMYRVFTLYKN